MASPARPCAADEPGQVAEGPAAASRPPALRLAAVVRLGRRAPANDMGGMRLGCSRCSRGRDPSAWAWALIRRFVIPAGLAAGSLISPCLRSFPSTRAYPDRARGKGGTAGADELPRMAGRGSARHTAVGRPRNVLPGTDARCDELTASAAEYQAHQPGHDVESGAPGRAADRTSQVEGRPTPRRPITRAGAEQHQHRSRTLVGVDDHHC